MNTIYKYAIEITDVVDIELPEESTILSAGMQNGTLCIWAQVNKKSKTITKKIYIFGTGHPMPDIPLKYICTVFDDSLVWHIYQD